MFLSQPGGRIRIRSPLLFSRSGVHPQVTIAFASKWPGRGIEAPESDPGRHARQDIYALSPERLKGIPTMPGSLEESLDELEADHDFLLKGDVFTEACSRPGSSTSARRGRAVRMRPTRTKFGALLRRVIARAGRRPAVTLRVLETRTPSAPADGVRYISAV